MAMASTLDPPTRRSNTPPIVATTNDGVLPLDVIYDILLRLPTESICRFRAVSRSWRSLLCHPDYIAAARNPGPRIAIGMSNLSYTNEINLLELESGDAIKRANVATTDPHSEFLCMGDISHDGLVCVADRSRRLHLLDLTSGVVSPLPDYARPPTNWTTFTVARTTSKREHKLLAISTSLTHHHERQVCRILTVGSAYSGWRDTGHPPISVEWQAKGIAVVNEIAYFLSGYLNSVELETQKIMVFDVNSEAWRPMEASLQGPGNHRCDCLSEIDGQLVAGHTVHIASIEIELWFLEDMDKSYWSKRYTITMSCHKYNWRYSEFFVKPLAVLDDGRIVLWMRATGAGMDNKNNNMKRIYDPRTKTYMDGARVPHCTNVSVLTWNLLHSGRRGVIDMVAKRLLIDRRRGQSRAPSDVEGPNTESE
ncbi:unnamed protein product [Alopecurus aequalis]